MCLWKQLQCGTFTILCKEGFPTIRHNEIRKSALRCVLNQTCSQLHPTNSIGLQPIPRMVQDWMCQLTESGVADIRKLTLMWGCLIRMPPQTGTSKHELEKKRAYQQWVQDVEQFSFTPLVLSATGGMGAEATTFYKCLAAMLSQKWKTPYSKTLSWLRCRLSYSLIRSAIQAIRGARSSQGHAARSPLSIHLITTEAHISPKQGH